MFLLVPLQNTWYQACSENTLRHFLFPTGDELQRRLPSSPPTLGPRGFDGHSDHRYSNLLTALPEISHGTPANLSHSLRITDLNSKTSPSRVLCSSILFLRAAVKCFMCWMSFTPVNLWEDGRWRLGFPHTGDACHIKADFFFIIIEFTYTLRSLYWNNYILNFREQWQNLKFELKNQEGNALMVGTWGLWGGKHQNIETESLKMSSHY